MRLKVVHHLELVLHVPEEEIGFGKAIMFFFGEKPMCENRPEGLDGVPLAKPGGPSSGAKLNKLDNELDFTDPAEPQLDVAMGLVTA